MDPKGLKIRESRDSDNHPNSLAVMVFLDVTGSMGSIPERLARQKLGLLVSTLINNGIADPQILFGAIGDHLHDRNYLQVGQFESDADNLDKWLSSIDLYGGGGGNNQESYFLSWIVAARHTSIDCFEKRGEKGFLFTIGDEATLNSISASKLKDLFGYPEASEISADQILTEALRTYNVFHIHCNDGSYNNDSTVFNSWRKLLGERFIVLDDSDLVPETIASIVGVMHGVELEKLTAHCNSLDAGTISKALVGIKNSSLPGINSGVITL